MPVLRVQLASIRYTERFEQCTLDVGMMVGSSAPEANALHIKPNMDNAVESVSSGLWCNTAHYRLVEVAR